MSLRQKVERLLGHQASATQRLEVWRQEHDQDAFRCRALPGVSLTRDELRARHEPGLLLIVVERYDPRTDGAP